MFTEAPVLYIKPPIVPQPLIVSPIAPISENTITTIEKV
jgi:hypothetical protein